jgi:arginase family enzyme
MTFLNRFTHPTIQMPRARNASRTASMCIDLITDRNWRGFGWPYSAFSMDDDRETTKGVLCLYRLTPHGSWQATVDLGDLRPGLTEEDTAAAVESVTSELVQMGIIPLIIGGGQDLTVSLYKALEILGQPAQVVTLDARLDFGADPEQVTSLNFMNEVILHEPNFLFDYTNLGHQGYLTDPDTLELLEKMQFEALRLGTVQGNIEEMEPILRDADLVSIDCGVIRAADHPAHAHAGPNGLSAASACQLARYAGMFLTAYSLKKQTIQSVQLTNTPAM